MQCLWEMSWMARNLNSAVDYKQKGNLRIQQAVNASSRELALQDIKVVGICIYLQQLFPGSNKYIKYKKIK